MNENKRTLSVRTIASYGIGYLFLANFYQSFLTFSLLFFMTDYLKISTFTAAALYSSTQFIQIITMLLSGVLIDSTNLKFGKYRSWILIGGSMVFIFAGSLFLDFRLDIKAASIYILIIYSLMALGFNLFWSANRALVGSMSRNSADSIALVTSANLGSSVSMIVYGIISAGFLKIFSFAGRQQYSMAMFAYSFLLMTGVFILLKISKNYDKAEKNIPMPEKSKGTKITLGEMIRSLKGQSFIFFLAIIIGNIQGGFFTALLVYFTTYVLNDAAAMGLALSFQSVGRFIGTALGPVLGKKFSKKTLYISCNLLNAFLYILIYFIGRTALVFIALRTLIGAVGALNGILLPAMSIDVADYNEMKGESRARAFVQSLMGTTLRIGGLISASVASFGLASTGYIAGEAPTAAIINKIILIMGIGPALVCALASLVMSFYKINERELDNYRAEKLSGQITLQRGKNETGI